MSWVPLERTGRRLLELGRSCVHAETIAAERRFIHLWNGLGRLCDRARDRAAFRRGELSRHRCCRAGPAALLSCTIRASCAAGIAGAGGGRAHYTAMDILGPEAGRPRLEAVREIPALIKAYLRLGGYVGDGAFVDRPFNTTDICLVMDTERLTEQAARDVFGGARDEVLRRPGALRTSRRCMRPRGASATGSGCCGARLPLVVVIIRLPWPAHAVDAAAGTPGLRPCTAPGPRRSPAFVCRS